MMPEEKINEIGADEKFTEMATRQQLINPFDAETSALKSRAPSQLLSHETVRLSRLNSFNSLFRQAAPIYHSAIKTGNVKAAAHVAGMVATAAKAVGTMVLLLAILVRASNAQTTLPSSTPEVSASENLDYLSQQVAKLQRTSALSGSAASAVTNLSGSNFLSSGSTLTFSPGSYVNDISTLTISVAAPSTPTANSLFQGMFANVVVNFVGASGAVNFGVNVTSITRNGTGQYQINFARPFANANYVCLGGTDMSADFELSTLFGTTTGPGWAAAAKGTASVGALTRSASAGTIDPLNVSITCFGTQ